MSDTHDQDTPEPDTDRQAQPVQPTPAQSSPVQNQGGDYGTPPPGAYLPAPASTSSYSQPPVGAYSVPGAYPPPAAAYPAPPQGAYPPPVQGGYAQPAGSYPPAPQGAYPPIYQPRTSRGVGFAVTSLVLGVGALVFSWIPFVGIIAGLSGIAAVVLGAVALAKAFAGKGLSIGGLVTGGLAVILSILLSVVWFSAIFSQIGTVTSHSSASSSPYGGKGGDDGDSGGNSGGTTFHSTTQTAPVAFGGTVSYDNGVTVTVPTGTPYTPQDSAWSTQAVDLGYDVTVHNGSTKAITVNLIGETTAGGTDGDDILDPSLDTMKDFSLPAGATHTYHIAFSVASQNDVTVSVSIADHYDYADFSG